MAASWKRILTQGAAVAAMMATVSWGDNGTTTPANRPQEAASAASQPSAPLFHEDASLARALSRVRHAIDEITPGLRSLPRNEDARYFCSNPSQELTARFLESGTVRIHSGRPEHSWELRLDMNAFPTAPRKAGHDRIEISRTAALAEWYVNGPSGIEHGFTVQSSMADAVPEMPGLQLRIDVDGLAAESDPASERGDLRFADDQGRPILGYRGLRVWDAEGTELAASMSATKDGRGILYSIADPHATYPITIDPMIFAFEQKLRPEVVGTSDFFDDALFLDGDTAIIGAPGAHTARADNAGRVYVFTKMGMEWSLQQVLEASDSRSNDRFGEAVCVEGDTALVGTPGHERDMDPSTSGAAYVFTRSGSTWTQSNKIELPVSEPRIAFGRSIAIEGNTAIIAGYVAGEVSSLGDAYVFARDGSAWSLQQALGSSNKISEAIGAKVDLSGNTAIVSTSVELRIDSVYVFEKHEGMWTMRARLRSDFPLSSDGFALDIDLSGDRIIAGAYSGDAPGVPRSGLAYVFHRTAGVWAQQQVLTAAQPKEDEWFGFTVGIDGDTILVGAPVAGITPGSFHEFEWNGQSWVAGPIIESSAPQLPRSLGNAFHLDGDTLLTANAGVGYVFTRDGGDWSMPQMLETGDGGINKHFGSSLSLDGDTALVGVQEDDTPRGVDAGSVYAFRRTNGQWNLEQILEAGDGSERDFFGNAVGLDGDIAIAGALFDDSPTDENAGSAYVFARTENTWTEQQKLEAGDGHQDANFGTALAIDGNTMIVGARGQDTDGRLYVFTNANGTWTEVQKLGPSTNSPTLFGSSVDLSGDTAIVGAPNDDTGSGVQNAGTVYVYQRLGKNPWTHDQTLWADDAASANRFGAAIRMDGDTMLVGSPSTFGTGSAYVFRYDGTHWNFDQRLEDPNAEFPQGFGRAVDVDGNTLLVGSTCAAHLFEKTDVNWTLLQSLTARDQLGHPFCSFGHSAALENGTALVGASSDEGRDALGGLSANQGSAYAFRFRDATPLEHWRQDHFGTTYAAGAADDGFDANGNGLVNLLDFAFGLDPINPVPAGRIATDIHGDLVQRGPPHIELSPAPRVRFLRRLDHVEADLVYTVEFSSNLAEWFEGGPAQGVGATDAALEVMEAAFPGLLPDSTVPQYA